MKKIVQRSVAVFLMLSLVITLALTSLAATPTAVGYQFYLANTLLDNPVSQNIITGEYKSPYRKLVEDRKNDASWEAMLLSWETLTFDASQLGDSTNKAIGFYETVLFDVFCDSQTSDGSVDNLTALYKSTKAGTVKSMYDMYGDVLNQSLSDIKKDSTTYNKIMKSISNCKELSNAFKYFSSLTDLAELYSNVFDYIDRCAQIEAVARVYSQAGSVLTDISNTTSDKNLKYACNELKKHMTDSLGSTDLIYDNIKDDILFGLADEVLGEVWSAVVSQVTSYGLAIKTGQKLGMQLQMRSYLQTKCLNATSQCLRFMSLKTA